MYIQNIFWPIHWLIDRLPCEWRYISLEACVFVMPALSVFNLQQHWWLYWTSSLYLMCFHTGTLPNITRNALVNCTELVSYDLIKEAILKHKLLSGTRSHSRNENQKPKQVRESSKQNEAFLTVHVAFLFPVTVLFSIFIR